MLRVQLSEILFLALAWNGQGALVNYSKRHAPIRHETKEVRHIPNASAPQLAQKEVVFLFKAPEAQKMKNASRWRDGRQLEPGLPEAAEAYVQRSATRRFRRHYEPRSAEDMELILGVPKIVWVILCDVVAITGFLACIPLMMYLSKEPDDDDEEEAKETEPGPCSSCPCSGSDGAGKEDIAAVDKSNAKTVI